MKRASRKREGIENIFKFMAKVDLIRLSKGKSSIHPKRRRCHFCDLDLPDRQYAKHFNTCRFQAIEESKESEESKITRIATKWKEHFGAINLEIIAVRDLREKVREANMFVTECSSVSEWVKAKLSGPVTLRQKVKDLLNSEWTP